MLFGFVKDEEGAARVQVRLLPGRIVWEEYSGLGLEESDQEEQAYQPTSADLALAASLIATEVGQNVMQLHADGELTTKGYTVLYEVSRRAMAAVEKLHQRLEQEEGKK